MRLGKDDIEDFVRLFSKEEEDAVHEYNFGHWVQPNGQPFTKEAMREHAIKTFKRLLEDARRADHFQDGSRGQAMAFEDAMLRSLEA